MRSEEECALRRHSRAPIDLSSCHLGSNQPIVRSPSFRCPTEWRVSDILVEKLETRSDGQHHAWKSTIDERITAGTALDDAR
jgi:hypothetical protein